MRWFSTLKHQILLFSKGLFRSKIRWWEVGQSYAIFALIVTGILPMVFLFWFLSCGLMRCEQLEFEIARLEKKTRFLIHAMKKREKFVEEFGASDLQYLQHYLEPLNFLSGDIEVLSKISQSYVAAERQPYEPIQERLHYLTGSRNKMNFVKLDLRQAGCYEEAEWGLSHPVDVNCGDVKQLLSLLEGVKVNDILPNPLRPQLFITKFHIDSTSRAEGPKVFSCDLSVLQRGYHACDQNHK